MPIAGIFLNFEKVRKMMKAFEIAEKNSIIKERKNRGETLMAVKDFMTRKVVYISPDTTVAHAADIMREQGLHRLQLLKMINWLVL